MKRRNLIGRPLSGFTLTEIVLFGAIAITVLIGIFGLLSRGSRILEIGRRTSSSQNDLRTVIERLTEDANELVYLDKDGSIYEGTGTPLTFFVNTSREERGLSDPKAGLRKIEYALEGSGELKSLKRTVTVINGTGSTPLPPRIIVESALKEFKVWSLVAVPNSGGPPSYKLKLASESSESDKGATVACFVIDVSAGLPAVKGAQEAMEKQPEARIVTRLWCRNRVLELARGALK